MEAEKKEKVVRTSPFCGRSDGVRFEGQKFKSPKEALIVDYSEVASVVKTGEGEHDFVIKKKLVPSSKQNRCAYINSFSGDVGIMNVLKKVAIGGQTIAEVVEAGRFGSQQGYVDISKMPTNIVDAYNAVQRGVEAFDKLPESLKKKQSFEGFVTQTGKKEINEYIASEVKRAIEAAKPKEVKKEEK